MATEGWTAACACKCPPWSCARGDIYPYWIVPTTLRTDPSPVDRVVFLGSFAQGTETCEPAGEAAGGCTSPPTAPTCSFTAGRKAPPAVHVRVDCGAAAHAELTTTAKGGACGMTPGTSTRTPTPAPGTAELDRLVEELVVAAGVRLAVRARACGVRASRVERL